MEFNSFIFLFLLLPLSVIGYYLINRIRMYKLALGYILGISLWFIGYMNFMYLLLLIPNVLVNYFIARSINSEWANKCNSRKTILTFGIVIDVTVLVVFKYYNFFTASLNNGLKLDIPTLRLFIPLGLSFYTFQQISYLVDCYQNPNIKYRFLEYSLYVCFFSQFVQGPIVLQDELIPQFLDVDRKVVDYDYLSRGFYRFVLGLSKKVLVADNIALIVDGGYNNIAELNSISAIVLIVAYTIQIYFDFSGYSDMAVGLGLMFHIDIPENFNSPYKAKDIADFWDRWHISLTKFFTRYIYIPLGGSRKGLVRTYVNVLIIFLVSGLWHGADWSFVIWGLMHGLAMVLHRLFNAHNKVLPSRLSSCITFIFVSVAWVFFRAWNIQQGIEVIKRAFVGGFGGISEYMTEPLVDTVEGAILCRLDIFGLNGLYPGIIVFMLIVVLTITCMICKNTKDKQLEWTASVRNMIITVTLTVWCVLSFSGVASYIYWNF